MADFFHRAAPRAALVAGVLILAACAGPEARPGAVAATDIGPVLVDAQGYTLYVHVEDPPGVSLCTPACTVYWPPAEAPAGARGGGDVSIVVRQGGTRQWAYKGKPLYHFAFELAPGRTGGDGAADGEWRAARP